MIQRRIIVAGTRTFNDYGLVKDVLEEDGIITDDTIIVSGCASGADQLGERFAKERGLGIVRFPANWQLYGNAAGPIRNKEMAKFAAEGDGWLYAFWDGKSRGTKSMIDLGINYGLQTHVLGYKEKR